MRNTNKLGEQVIAISPNYYTLLHSNESIRCCDEYQDVMFCFANDTKQGCSYCEFDPYAPCQCELSE